MTGATSYRLQVATDRSFADPIEDRVVVEAEATLGPLAPRAYLWRVASIGPDGAEAPFSQPNGFTVDDGSVAVAPPPATIVEARFAPAAIDPRPIRLSVPYITQHKDTTMLLLESPNEKGQHAWDVDHVVPGRNDPADKKNCAIAAVAMMNRFFGGDMSQDRLGFELFKNRSSGPEKDLNYGTGLSVDQATQILAYALQATPRVEIGYLDYKDAWDDITASIQAGRPVMGANTHHTFVITAYQETAAGRIIWYNDPANGRKRQNLDTAGLSPNDLTLWIVPAGSSGRDQEVGVTKDSDGDGVRDFDETERFHTNPGDPDSDRDKLRDKADIITGVFDPRYGYAICCAAGRDFDSDDLPTERDKDSDGGGCWDGEEDTSGDGHRTGRETYNFDIDDDPCIKYHMKITWWESWGGNVDKFDFEGEAGNLEPSADDQSIFLTGAGTVSGSRAGWAACSVNMAVPSGSGPAFFGATIVGDKVTVSAFADFIGLAGLITQPLEMPKEGGTQFFSGEGGGGELCPFLWRAKVVLEALPAH